MRAGVPGAEILRREILAEVLSQVGVDLPGVHDVASALLIHVLEQVLAGQLPAFPHQHGETAVRAGGG